MGEHLVKVLFLMTVMCGMSMRLKKKGIPYFELDGDALSPRSLIFKWLNFEAIVLQCLEKAVQVK